MSEKAIAATGAAQTIMSKDGKILTSQLEGKGAGAGNNGKVRFVRASELRKDPASKGSLVAEGIYEGLVPNEMTEKNDFKVREADGTLVILNNTASLANQLSNLELGSYVAIQYNGTTVIKSGARKGKEAHQFNVFAE